MTLSLNNYVFQEYFTVQNVRTILLVYFNAFQDNYSYCRNIIVVISFLSMGLKALSTEAGNYYPCFMCEERVKR